MFSFHKVTLADKDWMQPLLFHDGWSGSEYTFGTNILWGVKYHIEACKSHGCCIVRYGLCGEYPWDELMHGDCFIYSFPIGPGDKKAALDELIAFQQQLERCAPDVDHGLEGGCRQGPGRGRQCADNPLGAIAVGAGKNALSGARCSSRL